MTGIRSLICAAAVMVGALFVSTGAFAQGAPLFGVLNGGNECSVGVAGTVCRKGDLDAFGSVTIIFPTATSVCFGIVVDNLAGATAAHIHTGVSGVNGAPVVTLVPPPAAPGGGNPGASSGCVAAAAATVSAIRADPTRFYVNVHNNAFPNGAIRGQLF